MSASLDKEGLAEVCMQLAKAYEKEWREADKLVQQGVQEERKRIVAWLRNQWSGRLQSPVYLSHEIEAGEHLK